MLDFSRYSEAGAVFLDDGQRTRRQAGHGNTLAIQNDTVESLILSGEGPEGGPEHSDITSLYFRLSS